MTTRTARKARTTATRKATTPKATPKVTVTVDDDKATTTAALKALGLRSTPAGLKAAVSALTTATDKVAGLTARVGVIAAAQGVTSSRALATATGLSNGTAHNAVVAGRLLAGMGGQAAGQETLAARYATRAGARGVDEILSTGKRGAALVAAVTAGVATVKAPAKDEVDKGGQGGKGEPQATGKPRGIAGHVDAASVAVLAAIKSARSGAVVTDATALSIDTLRANLSALVEIVGAERIASAVARASVESKVDAAA